MRRIRERWGALIQEVCRYSPIPEEFLAALIANESGGDSGAERFEPKVYLRLVKIRASGGIYGPLTAEILRSAQDDMIRAWATSWGLTQIVGYHAAGRPGGIELLKNPQAHLDFALRMLAQFAEQYAIDVHREAAQLFRCWNTGGPYGLTADPKYVQRGLARMEIYRNSAGSPNPES